MEPTDAVKAELKTLTEQVIGYHKQIDGLQAEIKALNDQQQGSAEVKEQVAKLVDEIKTVNDAREALREEMTKRQDEFEVEAQKRLGYGGEGNAIKSAISTTEMPEMNVRGDRGSFDVDIAPLKFLKEVVNPMTSADFHMPRQERVGIQAEPDRPLRVWQLPASGTLNGLHFDYEREKADGEEGDADYQHPEGSEKAEYSVQTELVQARVATIAVYSRIGKQTLDDKAGFESWLRARLGFKVLNMLDHEVLIGNGNTGRLQGIKPVATAFDPTLAVDADVAAQQRWDTLRLAFLQLELANYNPDAVVLHPIDLAAMDLKKDGENRYLVGTPNAGNSVTPWGYRAVSTVAQTEGEFTAGAFQANAQLFFRQGLTIDMSYDDQDNFIKNLVTVRAELRALQAIYSALAFVDGEFNPADT